jgi:hypothetical protein
LVSNPSVVACTIFQCELFHHFPFSCHPLRHPYAKTKTPS